MSDFVSACRLSDVPEGGALHVEIEGEPLAIVRTEGEVFAIRDVCSHADVRLSEGEVLDCTIECWLHGSQFDLRTGEPISLPAVKPVPVYPVRVEGDEVAISLNPIEIESQRAAQ